MTARLFTESGKPIPYPTGQVNPEPELCGAEIGYPREGTGICERVAGHQGMHRRGLAAIESDERIQEAS